MTPRRSPPDRTARDDVPWCAHTVDVRFRGAHLSISTAHGLFSHAGVDVGTTRLLRSLEMAPDVLPPSSASRVLDLGCGVGVLGLAVARALDGAGCVVLSDRDRLAVTMARCNATWAGIDPDGEAVRVLPAGVGYAPIRAVPAPPFDLILSNIPAKVGRSGLAELLFGAGEGLRPGGAVAFVHVLPLSETIDELAAAFEAGGRTLERVHAATSTAHRVLHWRFPDGLPPRRADGDDLLPWRRPSAGDRIELRGIGTVPHRAVQDVDEFDEEHHRNELLCDLVADGVPAEHARGHVLVLHPEHGLLAARFLRTFAPARLQILGRDELALAVALANLAGARGSRSVPIGIAPGDDRLPWLPRAATEGDGLDLVLGHLQWDEGPRAHVETLRHLAAALRPEGRIALAVEVGRVPSLRRLAKEAGLRTGRTVLERGFGAVVLRRDGGARP